MREKNKDELTYVGNRIVICTYICGLGLVGLEIENVLRTRFTRRIEPYPVTRTAFLNLD